MSVTHPANVASPGFPPVRRTWGLPLANSKRVFPPSTHFPQMGPILICTATGLLATFLFPLPYRISEIFKRSQCKIPDSQPTELRKFNWHWRPNTGLHIIMRRVHDPPETIPAVAPPSGYTDEQLLEHLRTLLSTNGKLSGELIKSTPDAPPLPLYKARFGGLSKAYRLVGYRSTRKP